MARFKLPQRAGQLLTLHVGWFVLLAALGLTLIGILAISTADHAHTPPTGFGRKQSVWLIISLTVMCVCMAPRPKQIGLYSYALFVALLLLLAVIVLPIMPRSIVPVRNGTRAWINLGFMNFQPSEITKIAFVLAVAWYLRHRENYRSLRGLLVPFLIMLLPVLLILKQPDLGTAILFGPALFAILLAAGAKLRHLGALLGLAVLAIVLNVVIIYTLPDSMQVLRPHQRMRIKAMISLTRGESKYIKDEAYQQNVAKNVSGSGRITGYGRDRAATIIGFNRLPEDHNDMIFAVIVARWGLLGGALVLLLYALLIGSMLVAAGATRDPFARLAIVGFTGLIAMQAFINMGMTIGLPGVPIIGITLPFVSYGGSSLLATFAMVGLVVNFCSARPTLVVRPSFEFGHRSESVGRNLGPTI